ncbi:MAG: Peptidase C45, acyl-coenzyme A:6-aminopenicillanic acid acyl-transferase [candidate division TM6 bacterium GW2011_GWF2_32_72]|nr:MAG: Peptidase C45, acyl-coenzyme A:6-aminopenicillanic acid acyl-transferase [candidate division TM6 bacterium GW2011_GWF2_32_72]
MKKSKIFFVIVLTTCLSSLCLADEFQTKVIEVNKVILPKKPDTYMEVRHIVLRGSNKEIGNAFGKIAQDWLGVKQPDKLSEPLYAKANQIYIGRNYPILSERIKGIAQAYNLPSDVNLSGSLSYDLWPEGAACSMIYFPPNRAKKTHAFVAHNFDFFPMTFAKMMNFQGPEISSKLNSRNFVMELYPNKGYASIGIGSMDLVSGLFTGMNSQGLLVSQLVCYGSPVITAPEDMKKNCGLDSFKLLRLLLDTCANVEEAKMALLVNKMAVGFKGIHFEICDKFGSSVICEMDPKTFQWRFTDNKNAIQIMTNHPQYVYSKIADFPSEKIAKASCQNNSFNRYLKLDAFIKNHNGKFSLNDGKRAMEKVYSSGIADMDYPLEMRTFWTEIYNLTELTMEVKFYLRDGTAGSKTGKPSLVFSKPFKFKLNV